MEKEKHMHDTLHLQQEEEQAHDDDDPHTLKPNSCVRE